MKAAFHFALVNMKDLGVSDDRERALRIVALTNQEETRRLAHTYRARAQLGLHKSATMIPDDAGDDIVEAALIDFDAIIAEMQDNIPQAHWSIIGKGVGAELGHVDQFGSWNTSRQLDESIRRLPKSNNLRGSGIHFDYIYDEPADVRYQVHRVESGPLRALTVLRKRAVANVIGSTGQPYDIIRKSTFEVDRSMLTPDLEELVEVASPARDYQSGSKEEVAGKDAANAIGSQTVGRLIENPSQRRASPIAVPLSSMYMALLRHEDIPYVTT